MCGISLVAQLATLPLILYYFGTFPTYFLLTNLVMIPLGTLLVYACLLLFILSPTPLASWLEWPITFLTSSMQTVTQFISTMPGAQLTNLHIGLFQAACLYALLFCLYRFYLHPMPKTLYPVLWSIIAGLVIWWKLRFCSTDARPCVPTLFASLMKLLPLGIINVNIASALA